MPKNKVCSQCLSLIGEETRIKIIQNLKKGPANVSQITAKFKLTQPTISHHLKILEKMKIIFCKKSGREVFYFLNKKYPCKKCSLFKTPFRI